VFYFGCVDRPGHYLFISDTREVWHKEDALPSSIYPKCDTGFCRRDINEKEGAANVAYVDGYTILAFWDRSVDKRGKSNSAFIEKGTFTFEEMIVKAKQEFPKVWARFTFEVCLA
jgi:hypothetical protein